MREHKGILNEAFTICFKTAFRKIALLIVHSKLCRKLHKQNFHSIQKQVIFYREINVLRSCLHLCDRFIFPEREIFLFFLLLSVFEEL